MRKKGLNLAVLNKNYAPKITNNNEKILDADDFIVSKASTKGIITYCNEIFVQMSGYEPKDLIGSNHNLVRHPDMPMITFKLAWQLIKDKKEFFGFLKNLRADGGFYWVFTYITPDLDENSNIIGFTSFRRKPTLSALEIIIPLYKKLIEIEKNGGMKESQIALENFLKDKKISYNEFVINLQKGIK